MILTIVLILILLAICFPGIRKAIGCGCTSAIIVCIVILGVLLWLCRDILVELANL